MSRQKKSSPVLPALHPNQRFNAELQALAETLVEQIISSMWGIGEPFDVDSAIDLMYSRLMATVHRPTPRDEDDDEVVGLRMCAYEDARLMIGFALGRRIGGAR